MTATGSPHRVLHGSPRRHAAGAVAALLLRNRAWFAVAVVLVLAGVAGLAVERSGADRRRAEAQASAAGRAALLPPTPDRAARTLLAAVAADDATVCFLELGPAAAAQLAAATDVPDCRAAVHALAGRVVDPQLYRSPDVDAVTTVSPDGRTGTVDACHLSWGGPRQWGPQLGRLDLSRVLDRGYQIVALTPC